MTEVPVPRGESEERAEVDRCDACGGLFLEFFDGEPSGLARSLLGEARPVSAGPADPMEPSPSPTAAALPEPDREELVCPDCERALSFRAYLGEGPELPRCEVCLAVFLTPALLERVADLELSPEPEAPSWLERLMSWLPSRD